MNRIQCLLVYLFENELYSDVAYNACEALLFQTKSLEMGELDCRQIVSDFQLFV